MGHPLSAREITSRMLLKSGLAVDQEDARGVQEMMSNGDIRKFLLNQPAESILLAQDDSELNVNDSDNETTSPEPCCGAQPAGCLQRSWVMVMCCLRGFRFESYCQTRRGLMLGLSSSVAIEMKRNSL